VAEKKIVITLTERQKFGVQGVAMEINFYPNPAAIKGRLTMVFNEMMDGLKNGKDKDVIIKEIK
jgi:hypothetical protein